MKVSILGCGWLGFPVAKALVSNGVEVQGSTTSFEKINLFEQENIIPYQIDLLDQKSIEKAGDSFFEVDVLLISVPPKRQERELYLEKIQNLNSYLSQSKHIVFTSSTSVYPNVNRVVKEEDLVPDKPSGQVILEVEKYLQTFESTCVLRLAGLMGGDRHPGRFFANKKSVPNGLAPVNMIHQEDVMNVVKEVILNKLQGVYNVCSIEHPLRKEFYAQACRDIGLSSPVFEEEVGDYKIINGESILDKLSLSLKYPNPLLVFEGI